ncbi:MarR family transcriptional regulator [Clostridium sp. 19966]|uniref:MarR family winged helix-turn-helix transcriptional regulator n=1 Tax=Clostridium sp. 19966 TaxID=2768166 RepID=UPI0028DDFDDA|nr:MarR family transcriptional regulator [Clostridium sp. 19966]MDT8715905.1 MarR family transcriptional regulator [Clostridium sp. 19966]
MKGILQRYFSLYRPLVNKLNELLGEYGLSHSLWQVILYIKQNGPSSLVDIANHYNIEKPSITRRVFALQEKSLVDTVPGKDRREKIIHLTETGEKLYEECRRSITELEYKLMEDITEAEQVTLFETLPKIQDKLTKEKGL